MELFVAGGVGEHGRNCFYVTDGELNFMVDCGIMAEDRVNPYPNLSAEQIGRTQFLFLTHSHSDHSGGLDFLRENGFHGKIIASGETLRQLSKKVEGGIPLENASDVLGDLKMQWGRSGHCAGSVWYRFERKGRSIFFSGDYSEDALVFFCDIIRGISADTAVLDCAYGQDTKTYSDCCRALVERTSKLLGSRGTLVFPVPKYGRGEELLRLFVSGGIDAEYFGDEVFIENVFSNDAVWRKKSPVEMPVVSPYSLKASDKKRIVFLSDPQLKNNETQSAASMMILCGGYSVMTGTVERDSYSAELISGGFAEQLRYPVHLNYKQYERLASENHFSKVIPYHSADVKM